MSNYSKESSGDLTNMGTIEKQKYHVLSHLSNEIATYNKILDHYMKTLSHPTENSPTINSMKSLQARIQDVMRHFRVLASQEYKIFREKNTQQIISTEERFEYHHGETKCRFIIFLRGSGCELAGITGGCTFCGFWNSTHFGKKISEKQTMAQIIKLFEENRVTAPYIALYNDGSMLNDNEISNSVLLSIVKLIAERSHVEKIILETNIRDITKEVLYRLKIAAGNKELAISFGYESARQIVRTLCINKPFLESTFKEKIELLRMHDIRGIPLVFFNPPFLTESQAIVDCLKTIIALDDYGFERIDLELPTVQPFTLLHSLWKKGAYNLPSYWAIRVLLELANRAKIKTKLYISPQNYTPDFTVKMQSCNCCKTAWIDSFNTYNLHNNTDAMARISCNCFAEWLRRFDPMVNLSNLELLDRILFQLDLLETSGTGCLYGK